MKIYFLPKHLIKRGIFLIVVFSFNASSLLNILVSSKRQWNDWSNILLSMAILVSIFIIAFYANSIYEPSIKILNNKIKIENAYSFLETDIDNLNHIETKSERLDALGDYKFEYIYFKKPVTSYIRFFGINLWKISKTGFRLDIVDEMAREEITKNYLKNNFSTFQKI